MEKCWFLYVVVLKLQRGFFKFLRAVILKFSRKKGILGKGGGGGRYLKKCGIVALRHVSGQISKT